MNNQENSTVIDEQETNPIVDSTPNQEDIFDQVFNMKSDDPFNANSENQVTEEPVVVNETVSTQTVADAKNDVSQYEYWQSQADKRANELTSLKQEMETLKATVNKQSEVKKETKSDLVKPEKPVKPSDFNHSDALADPESLSAQYLAQKEDYMDQMSDYIVKRDDIRDAEITAAQQKQAQIQQEQDTIKVLQGKYGYSPELAQNFMESMSSPQSLSLENLVKLHQLNMSANAPQTASNTVSPQAQQKQAQLNQRNEKLSIPKPIGVQPGASVQSPKTSTEDELMNAMIGEHKKVNPW